MDKDAGTSTCIIQTRELLNAHSWLEYHTGILFRLMPPRRNRLSIEIEGMSGELMFVLSRRRGDTSLLLCSLASASGYFPQR